ncbi:MAG: hypothetical protein J1E83_06535 [Lachnospiraceae bacterium]|nr:hypothetical protein [Lachnospiraceae bacterium]
MTNLLEIKELIKRIYSKQEVFILPVLKFLLAFVTLFCINRQLGYMGRIDRLAIVLIVSLLCSFLPTGFAIFFAAVFVLLHFYALAIEVALVGFCLFLVMVLLFFRFSPKDSVVVLLTPLCFGLKIPYVMPLAMGLIGTPASAVSVGCGAVIYYLMHFISLNANSIRALDEGEATVRLRMVIDGIINNKEMMVIIAAFAFTVIVVYIIRRLSIDHSWTIAMVAGNILNVVILLMGDLMYDINVSVPALLLGSLISLGLVAVLQFFVFSVDYSRTEKVQFEDDEYYYYVKAVPKMTVAVPEKTVKRINAPLGRSTHTSSAKQPVRNNTGRNNARRNNAGRNNAGRNSSGRGGVPRVGRQVPSRTISTQNNESLED